VKRLNESVKRWMCYEGAKGRRAPSRGVLDLVRFSMRSDVEDLIEIRELTQPGEVLDEI